MRYFDFTEESRAWFGRAAEAGTTRTARTRSSHVHTSNSGRWLRLWTTDQHYLINVQQVVAVTELGEV